MARITIDLTDAAHDAFRAAVEANGEGSQVNAVRKLVMAYAERKIWFDRTDPRCAGRAPSVPEPVKIEAVRILPAKGKEESEDPLNMMAEKEAQLGDLSVTEAQKLMGKGVYYEQEGIIYRFSDYKRVGRIV